MRWCTLCFFILVCAACTTKPVVQKATATVLDSNRVAFNGAILDHDALQQLKNETLSTEEWLNVLPVVLLPADNDKETNNEEQITGSYTVNDTAIVFTAQKSFEKHKEYVGRFYSSDSGLSYLKMAQSKQNLKGPQQTEFHFKIN